MRRWTVGPISRHCLQQQGNLQKNCLLTRRDSHMMLNDNMIRWFRLCKCVSLKARYQARSCCIWIVLLRYTGSFGHLRQVALISRSDWALRHNNFRIIRTPRRGGWRDHSISAFGPFSVSRRAFKDLLVGLVPSSLPHQQWECHITQQGALALRIWSQFQVASFVWSNAWIASRKGFQFLNKQHRLRHCFFSQFTNHSRKRIEV